METNSSPIQIGKGRSRLSMLLEQQAPQRSDLPRVARDEAMLPASSAQLRLWRDYQLRSTSNRDAVFETGVNTASIYHSLLAIRLNGNLQVDALTQALNLVVVRHEALRTRVVMRDGQLCQRLQEAELQNLVPEIVACETNPASLQLVLRERMREFVALPFDLAGDQMLRARLLRVTSQEHVLLIIVHHIASDGWSMGLLYEELMQAYQAIYKGQRPDLPELSAQYIDYAKWEAQANSGDGSTTGLQYWRQQLDGAQQVLALPTDRARPPVQRMHGASVTLLLPAADCAAALRLANHAGVSAFQLYLAVVQIVLARWTGQADLIVGTPAANRILPETERIIGLFVNLLPLRLRLDERGSFLSLLSQVRNTVLDAFEHQNVPFDQIVAECGDIRSVGCNPIVQAVLLYAESTKKFKIDAGNVWAEVLPYRHDEAVHFDLTFDLVQKEETASLTIYYASDLFEADTVHRLAHRFKSVLQAAIAAPSAQLMTIPTVTDAERELLEQYAKGAEASDWQSINAKFKDWAAIQPNAPALVLADKQMTYGELNARIESISVALSDQKLAAGELVGICLPRSDEGIAAMLGVLRSGAAFIPLDPESPPDRLSYILADAGVRSVIGNSSTLPLFSELQHRLDVQGPLLAGSSHGCCDTRKLEVEVLPEQLAYVIYTSGSTGRPKGVEVSQRGLSNFIAWYVAQFALTPKDRCLQIASPSFDASILDTLPALTSGASLFVGDDEMRLDPDRLWQRLGDACVTVAFLTTPLFNAALSSIQSAGRSCLRSVQVGGDRLLAIPDYLPFTLHNLYGPTEATIAVTCGQMFAGKKVHIGRPIAGAVARVLDENLRHVPLGSVGQLYLSGLGLARGYRHRSGLSAARFIPNPFGNACQAERMYSTGDKVRWVEEGYLEYLGRDDDQVKVRGHRIELSEIESVLMRHPTVAEVVVAVHVEPNGANALCAYLRPQGALDLQDIRSNLAQKLPAWMLPARYVLVSRFALTINGKLDRNALPKLGDGLVRPHTAPEGPVAELVAGVWSELLAVENPSSDDDFFSLGGHSLLVTRMQSRLSQQIGCDLPFSLVFDHPTLGDFATALEKFIFAAMAEA